MKNGNKNYLEMPKGLVKDYGLTAKPLFLYYILKEYEQAFCTNERHTFTVDDTRLKNAMGCGRNQLYEYKKILKEAGLIICRKNGYGICEYRLPYLNNYVDFWGIVPKTVTLVSTWNEYNNCTWNEYNVCTQNRYT